MPSSPRPLTLPLTILGLVAAAGSLIADPAVSGGFLAERRLSLQQPRYSVGAPVRPDPVMTPGDSLPVTAKDICAPGYSKKVRNVPQAVKEQAYKNYGITHREKGEYEVDHLVSLELGGSNSIKNLWPQSYRTTPWNANVKNKLENAYHKDICAGRMDIKVAQQKIARNWIDAYKERFPRDPVSRYWTPPPGITIGGGSTAVGRGGDIGPIAGGKRTGVEGLPPRSRAETEAEAGRVWVNTQSGLYWMPGTRYYGKTKEGKYLSETEAKKAGYRKAGGQ